MIVQGTLIQKNIGTGPEQALRSGDVVSLKVLKGAGKDWEVSVRGTRMHVTSSMPLHVGTRLSARVFFHGKTTVFQVRIPLQGGIDFLRDAGIPDDGLTRLIVRAFQASGLVLKPEMILQARNRLQQGEHRNSFAARIIALLYDKGIEATSEMVDALCTMGGDGRGSGHKPGGDTPEEKPDKKKVRALFREENDEDPLHLFNHLQGNRDHWVMVPFDMGASGENLTGSIRLRLEKNTGKVLDVHVFCGTVPRMWWFSLGNPGDKNGTLRIRTDTVPRETLCKEGMLKLRQNLHNLGVKVDDIIKVDETYDGISTEEYPSFLGIDTYV